VHASPPDSPDPLLLPFLGASTDAAAQHELSGLVEVHAGPLLRQVVRRHLGVHRGDTADAASDVAQTILLRLTHQLWRVRRGEADAIGSLAGYVGQTAANACHEWLRRRHPQRARLQQRVRYLLRHHGRLALWTRTDGSWICGRTDWRDRTDVSTAVETSAWKGRLAVPDEARAGTDAARLVALVEAIVDGLGGPARFEDVVTLAADALGIDDAPVAARQADDDADVVQAVDVLSSPAPRVDDRLVQAEFLAHAWREIVLLPVRQRTALLLNLTGPEGGDLLSLVPMTGIASWGELAGLLALPLARMRQIADALPCDDNAIADLLGVTRRQVINLRKCARERLARRLGLARGARREVSR
jgi:DNA-directed RNA polymerase specialized sigma24 family protein